MVLVEATVVLFRHTDTAMTHFRWGAGVYSSFERAIVEWLANHQKTAFDPSVSEISS